jgi:cell division protein FtsB
MSRRRPARAGFSERLTARLRFRQSGAVIASLVMVVISCWMLAGIVSQVVTGARLDHQRAAADAEIAAIEQRNAQLEDEVTYAESPAYAEQVAREQLGMAREGDTVILPTFPEVTPTPAAPTPAPVPSPTPQPNWRGWQRALFP